MEEEHGGGVPCSSVAVESVIQMGTAGAIWGLCSGPHKARKRGLIGTVHASFVVNASLAGALAGAAVAAGTRNWTTVVQMAGLVSVFSTAADYYKTF